MATDGTIRVGNLAANGIEATSTKMRRDALDAQGVMYINESSSDGNEGKTGEKVATFRSRVNMKSVMSAEYDAQSLEQKVSFVDEMIKRKDSMVTGSEHDNSYDQDCSSSSDEEEQGNANIMPLQEDLDTTLDEFSSRRPLLSSTPLKNDHNRREIRTATGNVNEPNYNDAPGSAEKENKSNYSHNSDRNNCTMSGESSASMDIGDCCNESTITSLVSISLDPDNANTPTELSRPYGMNKQLSNPLPNGGNGGRASTHFFRRTNPILSRTNSSKSVSSAVMTASVGTSSYQQSTSSSTSSVVARMLSTQVWPLHFANGRIDTADGNPSLTVTHGPKQERRKLQPKTMKNAETPSTDLHQQLSKTKMLKNVAKSPSRSPLRRAAMSCWTPQGAAGDHLDIASDVQSFHYDMHNPVTAAAAAMMVIPISLSPQKAKRLQSPRSIPGRHSPTRFISTVTKRQRDGLFQSLSWDPVEHSTISRKQQGMYIKRGGQESREQNAESRDMDHAADERKSNTEREVLRPRPVYAAFLDSDPQLCPLIAKEYEKKVLFTSPSRSSEFSSNNGSPSRFKVGASKWNKRNTVVLQSPMRMDVDREDAITYRCQNIVPEHEDALNLLSCLVKQSVAFSEEADKTQHSLEYSGSRNDIDSDKDVMAAGTNVSMQDASDVMTAIDLIRKASSYFDENCAAHVMQQPDHSGRVRILDELVQSHKYAQEMRRAAFSAYSWLKAIGRDPLDGKFATTVEGVRYGCFHRNQIDETKCANTYRNEGGCEEVLSSQNVVLSQMLEDSERSLKEKEKHVMILDQELCKCRAEIGRLKSAARAEVLFKSPNRSIFDDDSDFDESSVGGLKEENVSFLRTAIGDITPVAEHREEDGENSCPPMEGRRILTTATSISSSGEVAPPNTEIAQSAEQRSSEHIIRKLKEELDKARQMMKDLELKCSSESSPTNNKICHRCAREDDHTTYENGANQKDFGNSDPKRSDRLQHDDERLINVRMLDGENFVTDWGDLSHLPPPPDHGLRAPIVKTVLTQWTEDEEMHESLLQWMDNILEAGTDVGNVPPLTISSLDHQVRDGFAMHVLPLLLRRSDVHVEVTTRAHRRTTYDISVRVARAEQSMAGECYSRGRHRNYFLSRGANSLSGNMSVASKSRHLLAFKASSGAASVDGDDEEHIPHNSHKVALSSQSSSRWDTSKHACLEASVNDQISPSHAGSVTQSSVTLPTSNRVNNVEAAFLPSLIQGSPSFDMNCAHNVAPSFNGQDHYWAKESRSTDDGSIGSSITGASGIRSPLRDNEERSVFMKAIGGALGGLLSRRSGKPPLPTTPIRSWSNDEGDLESNWNDTPPRRRTSSNMSNARKPHSYAFSGGMLPPIPSSPSALGSKSADEPGETYHRMVSAPPGRIGVTFVQYRGHAMVSDVDLKGPLHGWVHPCDILIAIDEVPVSGLRVKEIVKLLTTRKDKQRSLRVISSHAMSELTQNLG